MGSTRTHWNCSTPAQGEGLQGAGQRLQHSAVPPLAFPTHRALLVLWLRLLNTELLAGCLLQLPPPSRSAHHGDTGLPLT